MADETKLKETGQGGQGGQDKDGKPDERSENRFTELTQKLKEQETRHATEAAASAERIASLEFDNAFKDVVNTYPGASELKEKIRERVKAGLPVSEAAVIVLHNEKKLQTREEVERISAERESLGGSAATQPPKGKKRPEEMTTAELREELVEAERKGEIRYTPD